MLVVKDPENKLVSTLPHSHSTKDVGNVNRREILLPWQSVRSCTPLKLHLNRRCEADLLVRTALGSFGFSWHCHWKSVTLRSNISAAQKFDDWHSSLHCDGHFRRAIYRNQNASSFSAGNTVATHWCDVTALSCLLQYSPFGKENVDLPLSLFVQYGKGFLSYGIS